MIFNSQRFLEPALSVSVGDNNWVDGCAGLNAVPSISNNEIVLNLNISGGEDE